MFDKLFGPNVEKLKQKRDVNGLIKALENASDSQVRIQAAQALGYIRDTSAINSLANALDDADWNVRKAAAEALGQLRDLRAVDKLITALEDNEGSVRKAAAAALDKLGWKPDKEENKVRFLFAKGRFKECLALGTASVDLFIKALEDSNKLTQKEAIESLAQLGDARAVEPLIKALSDSNIRKAAAEALGQLGDKHAMDPLIKVLDDKEKLVQQAAAKSLDKLGTVEHLIEVLENNAEIADLSIQEAAAEALGKLCDTRAVDALITSLTKGKKTLRIASAKALIKFANYKPESISGKWAEIKWLSGDHNDHDDVSYSDCHGPHSDRGAGVPFPDPPIWMDLPDKRKKLDF